MEQRESHEMHSVSEETRQANASAPKVPETTHEPMYTSRLSRASSMTVREPIVRTLDTSKWPLMVFIFYATLTLFTWIVLCVASSRPIGIKLSYTDNQDYIKDATPLLAKHERILRAAQILQTVVALLTIPITSAMCSMALAAYIQAGSSRTKLNLRQTMALADQGWISPRIWARYSKVGSLPLCFALALTLVGAVFPIVQQTLVQVTPIRIPTRYTDSRANRVPDIYHMIDRASRRNGAVVRLRNILESTMAQDYEPYLWTTEEEDDRCFGTWTGLSNCDGAAKSPYKLDEITSDSWYAPVASSFSTGVYPDPQYVPRINTTIEYKDVTEAEWPAECVRDREGVFFTQYHGETEYNDVDVMACMLTDITDTPWQATYDRQDITEHLFLALSSSGYTGTSGIYKITARSTLGYFELPNVKNGNRPGPLLDRLELSSDYTSSGWTVINSKRATNETYAGDGTQNIGDHIGPLTAIGLALFGEGSFIERRLSNPSAFVLNRPLATGSRYPDLGDNCIDLMPLTFTLGSIRKQCLRDDDHVDEDDIVSSVMRFVEYLSLNSTLSGFTIAAFLANKEWLDPSVREYYDEMRLVSIDAGVPTMKTNIATWGVITGSVFLGLHLLGLLMLAMYALWKMPVMPWLGAEFVAKAGTAHADILSAAEGEKQWKLTVAACPGFIGDEKPTDAVGRIAFGATAAVNGALDRKFEEL